MKPYQQQSHYELLEIPVTAGTEQIHAAHERLQALYAPDSVALYTLADPSEADALRARLSEAYRVLTDPASRDAYDAQLRAAAAATPHVAARPTPSPKPAIKAKKGKRISGSAPAIPAPESPPPAPQPTPAPAVVPSWSAASYSFTWITPAPATTPSWQVSVPASVVNAGLVPGGAASPATPAVSTPAQSHVAPTPEPAPVPSGGDAGVKARAMGQVSASVVHGERDAPALAPGVGSSHATQEAPRALALTSVPSASAADNLLSVAYSDAPHDVGAPGTPLPTALPTASSAPLEEGAAPVRQVVEQQQLRAPVVSLSPGLPTTAPEPIEVGAASVEQFEVRNPVASPAAPHPPVVPSTSSAPSDGEVARVPQVAAQAPASACEALSSAALGGETAETPAVLPVAVSGEARPVNIASSGEVSALPVHEGEPGPSAGVIPVAEELRLAATPVSDRGEPRVLEPVSAGWRLVTHAPGDAAPTGAQTPPAPAPSRAPRSPSATGELPLFPTPAPAARPSVGRGPLPVSAPEQVRAIPPWPVTDETLIGDEIEADPITDVNAVPEDVAPVADDGEPEEIDPGELLELEPEPPVDSAGDALSPVQESLTFDPSASQPTPPPLPRRIERTVTPIQFQLPAEPTPAVIPVEMALAAPRLERPAEIVRVPPVESAPATVAPVVPPAPPPEAGAIILSPARKPEVQRPRVLDVPADAVFNGEFLRKVRQAREISLEEISTKTRIARKTLENVELDRYAELPAHVYLRGTLMSFATSLGLDPIRVARGYLELMQAAKPPRR